MTRMERSTDEEMSGRNSHPNPNPNAGRSDRESADEPLVDRRTPRFGQAVTATLLLAGVGLDRPAFVYVVATILSVAALSRWRVSVYAIVWRSLVRPLVGDTAELEHASPHRFATLVGTAGTVTAGAFLVAGYRPIGYAIATVVAALAGLAAVTGICVGCRMYRHVSFLREYGVV